MASSQKAVCVIPARYGSQRLPGKPLIEIKGIPLIMWVYNNIARAGAFDDIIVATDDKRISDAVLSRGGNAVMTSKRHTSGTDRICEAIKNVPCTHIVNVQGDEPLISRRILVDMKKGLDDIDDNCLLTCATNATIKERENPNVVKVVLAKSGDALYFSRSPIPFYRSARPQGGYKHIGIYGYTREGLNKFCALGRGKLEDAEKLEQLRALENGMRIRCLIRSYHGCGIDTAEDMREFKKIVRERRR